MVYQIRCFKIKRNNGVSFTIIKKDKYEGKVQLIIVLQDPAGAVTTSVKTIDEVRKYFTVDEYEKILEEFN